MWKIKYSAGKLFLKKQKKRKKRLEKNKKLDFRVNFFSPCSYRGRFRNLDSAYIVSEPGIIFGLD